MQLKVSPDNVLEWAALQLNLVPLPLLHAQVLPVLCKAVLEAVDRGVFQAVERGNYASDQIAASCRLDPQATRQLMGVLTSLGYFTVHQEKIPTDQPVKKNGYLIRKHR